MIHQPPTESVFVITHEFFPKRGGIATFAEEISRATTQLGYDVEVWAQAARSHEEKPWPFRMRRLPLVGTHDFSCRMRLARHLLAHRRRLRRSTVYLPEPGPMLTMMVLQFFKALRPKRLLLTFHGSEILRFAASPSTRRLTQRLIASADRVSTLTNYTHRLLCEHFPGARSKAFLTPGALRSDFDLQRSTPKRQTDRVVILTVGRLHPRKGQMFILEALKALPGHLRDRIEYWLVGDGRRSDYEDRLRESAGSCGFEVKFFGDMSDDQLDLVYDQADIFAMTSINHAHSVEGFGLVYLEAAAHGLPVVAHAVGGVPEAVVDEVTGILVPPVDLPALTSAFRRLVADPDLRQRFGHNGRDWARRNCWLRSAEALFNPVDTLVAAAA
jgi:phosphatidylinositol alpha-1,6-mannosyltransferase